MCEGDWRLFVEIVLIIIVIVSCLIALPIGRGMMRSDLLKSGYRVTDTQIETRLETDGGRWVIEVWRDGWVIVER